MNTTTKLVGLFDTCGTSAKIHTATCAMLKTAGKRFSRFDATEEELLDLRDRDYDVIYCKCTK